ncbi:MAG TPA: hypothetical protein PKN69_03375 [Candidatus Latescibacteria bacterium]|nr:hypothetical protein [Candidatus Latescibacterota bacterium]
MPATLTSEPHLFVDLNEVEERCNITRNFHTARKYGRHPVLKQDAPWEKHPGMTASVIYDVEQKVFKAWYMAGFYEPGSKHVQCFAVSDDGIHWNKPALGLHEALGSKENNIVIPSSYHDGMDHWESMLKDPLDSNPARRYKALGWSSYDWDGPLSGIYTATSPDGLNWEHTPEPVFRFHPRPGRNDLGPVGDAQGLMIDTLKKRYVAFLRTGISRSLSISEDFVRWTAPRPFLQSLNEEETLYNNVGFVYGNQYLGFLTHFDRNAYHQTQTLQLLTSRDGETWMRPFADPLIPTSDVGEWDRFQILLTGAPPIAVGDQLFIYYRGTARRHNKVKGEFEPRIDSDQDRRTMSIGLATLRLDGFASIAASYDGGYITTRPMVLGGDLLSVNAVSDYGEVRVEILDEKGETIPGYSAQDCIPVSVDRVEAEVAFRDRRSLSEISGRTVKLRFHLKNARLYSFRATYSSHG